MGFYGNITNTARTQFHFDLVYPTKYKMVQQCAKDGVYVGRYVLVDYDSNPNNVIKDGWRKGGYLKDFKDGDPLYASKNLDTKITYRLLSDCGSRPQASRGTSSRFRDRTAPVSAAAPPRGACPYVPPSCR